VVEQAANLSEAPLRSIYSFVPAGRSSGASDIVRRVIHLLSEFFAAEGAGRAGLLANFSERSERRPNSSKRSGAPAGSSEMDSVWNPSFTVGCADLTRASDDEARRMVLLSEAVFLVSATDRASISEAARKAAWLRSLKVDECCGLIVQPTPGGVAPEEAEAATGLPLCSVVRSETDLLRLAHCLAQD
jgi:hypothetical protein